MRVLTPSLKRSSTKEHSTCCRKLMASWMQSTFRVVAETCIICLLCSTTWLFAIKNCRCSRNVHSVSSMPSTTYLSRLSTSRRKVFHTEWERFSSLASLNYSIVPSCPKYTDTKMLWSKLGKVSKCVTRWSTTCISCANSTWKGKN